MGIHSNLETRRHRRGKTSHLKTEMLPFFSALSVSPNDQTHFGVRLSTSHFFRYAEILLNIWRRRVQAGQLGSPRKLHGVRTPSKCVMILVLVFALTVSRSDAAASCVQQI